MQSAKRFSPKLRERAVTVLAPPELATSQRADKSVSTNGVH